MFRDYSFDIVKIEIMRLVKRNYKMNYKLDIGIWIREY